MPEMLTSLRVDRSKEMQERAQRGAATRKKNRIEEFQKHHGLSDMYKSIRVVIHCRESLDWANMALGCWFFTNGFANITDDDREFFAPYLPGRPDHHLTESSDDFAWVAYLCSLVAVKERRRKILDAITERITNEWGAEYIIQDFDPARFIGQPDIPRF